MERLNKNILVYLSKYLCLKDLLQLTLVCKFLRNIIIDNNELWFRLLLEYGLDRKYIYLYMDKHNINCYQLRKCCRKVLTNFNDDISTGEAFDFTDKNIIIPIELKHLHNIKMCSVSDNWYTIICDDTSIRIYTRKSVRDGFMISHRKILYGALLMEEKDTGEYISCSDTHISMIENGNIYCKGSDIFGELGLERETERQYYFKKAHISTKMQIVSCGSYYTMAISENNQLYAFGRNTQGQLGLGHNNDVCIPTKVFGLENVTMVSCGYNHTAVVSDNKLYMFGCNKYHQLGLDGVSYTNTPIELKIQNISAISCGKNHTVIISNGNLYTFGNYSNAPTCCNILYQHPLSILCNNDYTLVLFLEISGLIDPDEVD